MVLFYFSVQQSVSCLYVTSCGNKFPRFLHMFESLKCTQEAAHECVTFQFWLSVVNFLLQFLIILGHDLGVGHVSASCFLHYKRPVGTFIGSGVHLNIPSLICRKKRKKSLQILEIQETSMHLCNMKSSRGSSCNVSSCEMWLHLISIKIITFVYRIQDFQEGLQPPRCGDNPNLIIWE